MQQPWPIARVHGGPDSGGAPLHDFSSNGNACGPCPAALDALRSADAARYPDPAYARLRERLASFHEVATERVVLAASASEFIWRATAWAQRQGGRRVWLPSPGYDDYALAAQGWGLVPTADAGAADLAWACEPSSPLGQAEPHLATLEHLARAMVVLDCAYEPLRLSATATAARRLPRAWQMWSPNKALGLTGVRAAYAIAPPGAEHQAAQLDALAPSWPLGAHGVALLQAWCDRGVQDWLARSLQTLREWKACQLTLCESMGWDCLPSDANFFVVRLDESATAHELNLELKMTSLSARLRSQGIKWRDCASFGLPGHARLSVQPPEAGEALRRALA